jgi:hypothetical protein
MKMEQGRQSEVENFNPREVHASRFLLENAWTLYWIHFPLENPRLNVSMLLA